MVPQATKQQRHSYDTPTLVNELKTFIFVVAVCTLEGAYPYVCSLPKLLMNFQTNES